MTLPKLDGYTKTSQTLGTEWVIPPDLASHGLWPAKALGEITRYPTGWLTIEQHTVTSGHDSDGVSTVIVSPPAVAQALKKYDWSDRSIGNFGIVDEAKVELGLKQKLGTGHIEFFCAVQPNHGVRAPTVEIAYPFLWFWDAIRDGNNWFYLDGAGREHELIRTVLDGEYYKVEVRALELRRYLGQRGMLALIQHDHVLWTNDRSVETQIEERRAEWFAFRWSASSEITIPNRSALSRLLGKHVIAGISGRPHPAWLEYGDDEPIEFIIDVDPTSGGVITFSCDPDLLSNYFGKNADAPNYLTPVHFEAKLLNRYLDEPARYKVSSTRISCLDMWSIAIDRTSAGDVEAYLGDIGRDLPRQELAHWRMHNIEPRGQMSEDRFRRDFLGQWAGELDPLEALRKNYATVNRASVVALGWPLFRPLDVDDLHDLEALHPPVLAEYRSLVAPIVTLTKALVDAIDSKAIRALLGPSDLQSLGLLEALITHLGGNAEITRPFKDLYRLRSSGGLAHLAQSSKPKVIKDLGLDGMSPAQVVDHCAARLALALESIEALMIAFDASEKS